jgi:hypothetical protein
MRIAYKILVAKPEDKRPNRRQDALGRIIIKLILKKQGVRV